MIIISHRANINGPNKFEENTFSAVIKCLTQYNLHVEIDIHVQDEIISFGHDSFNIETIIDLYSFRSAFSKHKDRLWIHCKNLEALIYCQKNLSAYNYFGHNNDEFVLTSKKYIFTRPGTTAGKNVICVMPELIKDSIDITKYAGVLTDYPLLYSK
jgi:hypothetical protein